MPWKTFKEGDNWCVYSLNEDGSKKSKVACHDDENSANEQVKALYANTNKSHLYEIFFADGEVSEDDEGLVWKDILKEGEWAYRPGVGQKPIPIPLKVVASHAKNRQTEIGLRDLLEAYEDGAIEHVTVPISHDDKPHENTGFVRKLKIEDRDGVNYLKAGIEFTEPDIKEKALRGTIANSSAGMIFDYIKKSSGKIYSQVLGHVALTNKPWINGMEPFGVKASEFSDDDITPLIITNPDYVQDLDDIEDESFGENYDDNELYLRDFSAERRRKLAKEGKALSDGSFPIVTREDLSNAIKAFGRAKNKSAAKKHIIKRAVALGETSILPDTWKTNLSSQNTAPKPRRSTDVKQSGGSLMSKEDTQTDNDNLDPGAASPEVDNDPATGQVELSEEARSALIEEVRSDFEAKLSERDRETEKLRKQLHEKTINERVEQLKGLGFSEYPGLLSVIRDLMLADNGKPALLLSEKKDSGDAVEVNLTASDVIERIIDAMPKEDGKLAFSDITKVDDRDRPKDEPDKTDLSERASKAAEFLGVEDYPTKGGDE